MGNGQATFDATNKRYFVDLAVTALYDAAIEDHVDRWRISFEHVSQLLFDATQGQMQLGTIYFLEHGAIVVEDDILLLNEIGTSFSIDSMTAFFEHSWLMKHVMNEPLVAVHELGHYIGTLGDEYYYDGFNTQRLCQQDPSHGACVMEFASGYGLRLDDVGIPSSIQPHDLVTRFCGTDHHVTFGNGQESKHNESCWDTLIKNYPYLFLPCMGTPANAIINLQWIVRSSILRYAFAVVSNSLFANSQVELAIKNAFKELIFRVALAGGELSIMLGSPAGDSNLRDMRKIDIGEVAQLQHEIDSSSLADTPPPEIENVTDQFHDASTAYNRFILLAPANSEVALGSLAEILAAKRIGLTAITLGSGLLDTQLDQLDASSKWVAHRNVDCPDASAAGFAFTLQNELLEQYFASTPGYGFVSLQTGRLPAIDAALLGKLEVPAQTPEISDDSINERNAPLDLNLEERSLGVDLPVYVEVGAQLVTFILSGHEVDSFDFSLLAPNADEFQPVTIENRDDHYVLSFDATEKISGCWILRLRRRNGTGELPYHLIAAVKNRLLDTSGSVTVREDRVSFKFQTIYKFPLDYVDTIVNIFPVLPDNQQSGMALRSLVLTRQQKLNPRSKAMQELSSGTYQGELQLEAGSYVAVFYASHHGRATFASNPAGTLGGNLVSHEQREIPTFSRLEKHRFRIP